MRKTWGHSAEETGALFTIDFAAPLWYFPSQQRRPS